MEYAIEAQGLAKRYSGGVWGITDVTFSSRRSAITVLLGPNGAGKTTTVKILSTLLKPTKGKAYVLGMDVVKEAKKVRGRIAICPQEVRVDPNWKPIEAITGYLLSRGWSLGDARREAIRWLKELELWDVKDRPVAKLSGGQGKRVAVAMTLASKAELYFLDEPTAGLDVEGKHRVWRILREVIMGGSSILLTTHDMNEAELLADYVVMIHKGKVVAEGTPKELISKVPYRAKVVIKGSKEVVGDIGDVVDLGDRAIVYTKSRREAFSIASQIYTADVSVSNLSLEDAYIYLIHKGGS